MRNGKIIDQSSLRKVLRYDPGSGIFTWLVCRPGVKNGDVAGYIADGYSVIGVQGNQYKAHRLAWLYMTGTWPEAEIDHRDGVRANNCWTNLRLADHSLNQQNLRKARRNSQTGLLGSSPCYSKFRAEIRSCGKQIYLGVFNTPEAAHAAYLKAKRNLHDGCTI